MRFVLGYAGRASRDALPVLEADKIRPFAGSNGRTFLATNTENVGVAPALFAC
jgi:hypothetical protein